MTKELVAGPYCLRTLLMSTDQTEYGGKLALWYKDSGSPGVQSNSSEIYLMKRYERGLVQIPMKTHGVRQGQGLVGCQSALQS